MNEYTVRIAKPLTVVQHGLKYVLSPGVYTVYARNTRHVIVGAQGEPHRVRVALEDII